MGRQWKSLDSVAATFVLLIGVSFLLCCAKAENTTEPTTNQNLSPIQAWRSAVYCLQNKSSSCPEKHTLSESGWLNVTKLDGLTFCEKGGCGDHTRAVLLCIEHVKRDYWFENNATVKDLYDTINLGCNSSQGFTGASLHSSHGFRLNSAPIITALTATALLFITLS